MQPAAFYQGDSTSWQLVVRGAFLEFSGTERMGSDPEKEGEGVEESLFCQVRKKLERVEGARMGFDAAKRTIRFFHHDREVQAIAIIAGVLQVFPKNLSVLGNRLSITLGKRGHVEMDHTQEGFLNFQQWKKECLLLAEETFKRHKFTKVNVAEFSIDSLKSFEGVCIGENHMDPNPKRLLMESMEKLYQVGVRTLFLEHLFYDSMQASLDEAHKGNKELPPYIVEYLKGLDNGFELKSDGFGYLSLVKAALKAKIRVVGIDTTASYLCGASRKKGIENSRERYLGMNFIASMIMGRERQKISAGKFVALMGVNHSLRRQDVPGVAEIQGVPAVTVANRDEKLGWLVQEPGFAGVFQGWSFPQPS